MNSDSNNNIIKSVKQQFSRSNGVLTTDSIHDICNMVHSGNSYHVRCSAVIWKQNAGFVVFTETDDSSEGLVKVASH
jgi:hypothetical protein